MTQEAGMRALRRAVDVGLPIVGIVVVLSGVLFFFELYTQLAVVVLGLFLIEAGIWRLADPLLPSQRRYGALRTEVDDFVDLVRRLNTAAISSRRSGDAAAVAEMASVREEMHASVERMVEYAGDPTDATSPSSPAAV
jgi:hypothetical protein